MSISNIQSRVKKIQNIIFSENNDKWRLSPIYIEYMDIKNNQDKKYCINYKGKKLIYDNIDDFYKEYNLYPYKNIIPVILDVIDNSYLEKTLYDANRVG